MKAIRRGSGSRVNPEAQLRRRRLLIIGLVLFALLDAALVAAAFSSGRVSTAAQEVAEMEAVDPTPSADLPDESEPSPEPEPEAIAAAIPARILVARDASLAWRSSTGTCPEAGALPELTTDGGATWSATDATAPTGVRSLQSISIEGTEVASMIGQTPDDCETTLVRTFVAGDNYQEYQADLGGEWYLNPLDRAFGHSPEGDFTAPCSQPLALSASGDANAAMLCDDQTVRLTSDAAGSWATSAEIPGAMNISVSGGGVVVVAAVGRPDCVGVQVSSIEEGGSVLVRGCLLVDAPPQSMVGNVALSQGDDTLWLWAGDVLSKSQDGGVTWQ